ncbi:carboxy terminal-processing peptidase [Psychrosphaera sp. 1_MG-2023]|uniref:carboxy terminal-processing peptidase n=1 Tax=Psychrosphaera sp. 1_MG-2023 TaxID=3062643 RepID=UPI0026E37F79|nr:carboxy terminal-processing peptidase [Psychrosphaera sp. 1_MG-2023]MDO6720121.1 carboxy terminal-processing peptidase [Psychrosphaera sp. 1_MG-2023]
MHLAQRLFSISVAATLVASCFTFASSDVTKFEAPDLQQESQHKKSIQRVVNGFSRYHYKKIELNDELSAKMWEMFVKTVDYNKSVFLQSDIDAFASHVTKFDDAMKMADLSFAFEFYEESIRRRISRLEKAIKLLDNKMDFTSKDDFYYDREDTPWAKTEAELNEFWRQKVKYDALNLKLAGKDEKQIKETLTKRYVNTMRRFSQTQNEDAFQLIMNSYARSIEAHTSYLSPRRADRFQMEMNLELEGIGAVLKPVDEFTVILSLVPGGPADKTEQLKPEDKIVGVAQGDDDYVDIVGWRLDEVVELIKGKKGTEVRLQIVRGENTASNNKEVKIIRDKVRLEDRAADSSVFESQIGELDSKVGVITIPSFYNNLSNDVKNEIKKLKDQNVDGIVVDLRGNGGGSLTEASLLTGLFIDKGPVVQIRNGVGNVDVRGDYDGITYYDGPLTVLVDRYSASASEIFSAALQDYGRALVVGEQTFGKGTVQEHRGLTRRFDLLEKKLGSVQFTVAKFYRINGGSTQHKGVIPDILFPSAVEPAEWGESQAENALPWDNIRPVTYKTSREISNQVKVLSQRHLNRIAHEPEFVYLDKDIAEYQELKTKKYVSLNEAVRLAEKEKGKTKDLVRLNERLTRLGFDKVLSLDDDTPEKLDELDPFLEETARILADLIASGQFAKVTK